METIQYFSCSFSEIVSKKKVQHWYISIHKDGMTIANNYKPIQLTFQYEKYPEFSMIDATWHSGGVEVEGHFKSDKFEMTVYYKDYYEDEDDEDKITSQDGNILVNVNSMNFSFPVQYHLAKALIQLGQGITTDLEGAIDVRLC
jgi:hypothetical protein